METVITIGIAFVLLLVINILRDWRDISRKNNVHKDKTDTGVNTAGSDSKNEQANNKSWTGQTQDNFWKEAEILAENDLKPTPDKEVRRLTEEEVKAVLKGIKKEHEAAKVIKSELLEYWATKVIRDFINGKDNRDLFTHKFRTIESNLLRMTKPDDNNCIEMSQQLPINLIEFCSRAFQTWSILEEHRKRNGLTTKEIDKYTQAFKEQCMTFDYNQRNRMPKQGPSQGEGRFS